MADFPSLVARVRKSFNTGKSRSPAWRVAQLEGMRKMLVEREREFMNALAEDFGKGEFETFISETGFAKSEIDYALSNLGRWLEPQKVPTPILGQPGSSYVVAEPYGVALIIGPWNYPLNLVLCPAVGALAAGNCVVIKPSELTPATSHALATWVPQYLDPECVQVVEGGVAETTALLEQRWDYIFFTGSTSVGKVIAAAAARHLTPVTLELGGKSPTIVAADADLEAAAWHIAWGKTLNCGQTCLAPDYLLVEGGRERQLIERITAVWREFYGPDAKASRDLARIVSDRHFARLSRLIDSGGTVACGGERDPASRFIAPTILTDVPADSPVMQEEVFGPVLPVLPVASIDDAIAFINDRPKPLALYLFTRSKRTQRRVVEGTSSGGVCVNDVILHYIVPALPFGGVGASGMGAYHGRSGFETFSHHKGVLAKWTKRIDPPFRYPPYNGGKLNWMRRVL